MRKSNNNKFVLIFTGLLTVFAMNVSFASETDTKKNKSKVCNKFGTDIWGNAVVVKTGNTCIDGGTGCESNPC